MSARFDSIAARKGLALLIRFDCGSLGRVSILISPRVPQNEAAPSIEWNLIVVLRGRHR